MKNEYVRIALFGFLSWAIPFIVAIPMFGPNGLLVDLILFKTIMILVGSLSSAFLLIFHFGRIEENFIRAGIIVGLVWFAINIGMDFLVLLPMSGQSVGEYFQQIGLRYLVIPITSVMVGKVLDAKVVH